MNPVIYSFASNPEDPRVNRLRESCARWGWRLDLKTGHWPGDFQFWTNFFSTLDDYRSHRFTHVIRLDAFDVAAVGPPSELAAALQAYNNPAVLISAEGAPWPGDYRKNDYPERQHTWWYAHSPLTIDLWQPVDPRFFQIPDRGYGSDQLHFADMILDKVHGIDIDRGCRVVQSLAHCDPDVCFAVQEGGRIQNRVTGSRPLFVHGNGIGKVPDWVP